MNKSYAFERNTKKPNGFKNEEKSNMKNEEMIVKDDLSKESLKIIVKNMKI